MQRQGHIDRPAAAHPEDDRQRLSGSEIQGQQEQAVAHRPGVERPGVPHAFRVQKPGPRLGTGRGAQVVDPGVDFIEQRIVQLQIPGAIHLFQVAQGHVDPIGGLIVPEHELIRGPAAHRQTAAQDVVGTQGPALVPQKAQLRQGRGSRPGRGQAEHRTGGTGDGRRGPRRAEQAQRQAGHRDAARPPPGRPARRHRHAARCSSDPVTIRQIGLLCDRQT